MQYKNLAVAAFAATAYASPDLVERQASSSGLNQLSVYQVLQTALPPSLISLATNDPAAASSVIASEFAGGQTPSWFTALPTDIQTYLVPAATPASVASAAATSGAGSISSALGSLTSAASSLISSANSSISAAASNLTATAANITATATGRNSSSLITSTSSTLGSTASSGGSTGASSAAAGSSSSSAGAALPTAVIGGGLAGALGLIGMLAL
ncbi:hypothetical protein EV356DRAFT_567840 [Viridothelium virens]|uniref:Uncharacterized protein n=1 Tax=Viridothelium virens TaxID=1048519 RepID=A0A6A6H7A9_VIRVR|nr:hypothetical protein EV356DRAFT_567840 [Viridothelium virens]